MTKEEGKLHLFVCDKVPQEIFKGSSLKVTSEEKKMSTTISEKIDPNRQSKQPDGIHTLAHGHFKTFLGGSSVSSGTTNNSSLTNPLLGAPSDK